MGQAVPFKCEFSKLVIPNDPKYATATASYVVEIAKAIGFEARDLQALELAVSAAIQAVIAYSFEPGESATLEVSCERVPEGIKVALRDKGLPYGLIAAADPQAGAASNLGQQIFRLKDFMDDVGFHNLGHDGKEIVLIKHLKNKTIADYYDACELEPYDPPETNRAPAQGGVACTVRQMKPEEASEVSKSIYKTYGYTYPHEFVYYPEKIIAFNAGGQIYSAVAVADGQEIAGHCALRAWDENPEIVEMVAGIVKPEFRSYGCFAGLTDFLVAHAQSEGRMGIFGQAVTNHVYSQRSGHEAGLQDCAIFLGLVPLTADFKGLNGTSSQKISMVTGFRFLRPPPTKLLYPPKRHEDIITKIYEGIGIEPKLNRHGKGASSVKQKDAVFHIHVIGSLQFARIVIGRYGDDIITELKTKLKELCLKKIEVIHLFLNLADPLTSRFADQFEDLGFFFAGVLPAGLPDGDALILQYLNNVPIDYARIQLESDLAEDILAHIRDHDPNRV
jgi:serine/threonine-protein kinase RsbW